MEFKNIFNDLVIIIYRSFHTFHQIIVDCSLTEVMRRYISSNPVINYTSRVYKFPSFADVVERSTFISTIKGPWIGAI